MLNISLVTNRAVVLDCCQNYKILYSPGHYLYLARNHGKIIGGALFEIKSTTVELQQVFGSELEDASLLDGIIRAGFNYANCQKIVSGVVLEDLRNTHRDLFGQLNFPNENIFNIENYFAKYKNCGG